MSFKSRGGGGGRGRGGGRFSGGRGGGRGNWEQEQGPPEKVIYVGSYVWPCQDELVIKADIEDVPFFNAPIYLENKEQIGKIDEIFGNPRNYYFSVKITEQANAKSFKLNEKVYIDPSKLLPVNYFLPQPPGAVRKRGGGGRGGRGGGGRGGRGGGGGRGGPGRGGGGFGGRGGGGRGGGGGGFGGFGRGGGRGGGGGRHSFGGRGGGWRK